MIKVDNKELKEAIEWIKGRIVYIVENCDLTDLDNKKAHNSLETVLNYIENSIPKQLVKETFKYIEDYFERLNGPDEDIEYIKNKKQELLEGK